MIRPVLAALFLATTCTYASAQTKIISLRGTSSEAPGNTLAAFGPRTSQIIELDTRVTSDGILVCINSSRVDAFTDGLGLVEEMTLAEIQSLDAGTWFAPEFSDQRILTLTSALEFITASGKQIYIDRGAGTPETYAAATAGYENNIYLGSSDLGFINSIHSLAPGLRLVIQGGDTEPDLFLIPAAANFGVVAFEWATRWITPESLEAVHENGLEAWTWAIRNRQEIRRMKEIGVDAILTPSTCATREILDEREPVSNWGPVAHYSFDNPDAIVDSINAHPGRAQFFGTAPTWTTGRFGVAYNFTGRGSFIRLPRSAPAWNLGNAITLSAWINPSRLPSKLPESQGAIFDQTNDAYALVFDRATRELRLTITDSDGTRETPSIPQDQLTTGTWQHVLGTYDGTLGEARIYLDGQLIDTHTNPELSGNLSTADPHIGRGGSNTNSHFHGGIDDVALWSRTLTQEEITLLATSDAIPHLQTALIAHYPLENTAEDTVNNLGGLINDRAPQGGPIEDGARGKAISVRGPNDFVSLPNSPAFDMRQPAISVNAWIRSDILPSEMLESSGFILGDLRNAIQLYFNISGEIRFRAYDTEADRIQATIPETLLTPGQWHMLTGVYSSDGETGTARTYLDGQFITETTSTTANGDVREAAILSIGTQGTRRRFHFPGDIDDLAIWNRPLAPEEITTLYTSELNAAQIYSFPAGNERDLLDFAFGSTRPAILREPDGTLLFTYPRRPDARSRGITYNYQTSESPPFNWTDIPPNPDDTIISTTGQGPNRFDTLGIPIPAPPNQPPSKFFRIQVSPTQ